MVTYFKMVQIVAGERIVGYSKDKAEALSVPGAQVFTESDEGVWVEIEG